MNAIQSPQVTANQVIALVGNPNSGKTTLFNALTGSKQSVGNWPGVTVEKKTGKMLIDSTPYSVVDLPGTYSIDVFNDEISLDERIARDYLINERPDLIINIVDASNLERNLYLTTEILETGIPTLIVLNMMDVATQRELEIECNLLQSFLKCPVIPVIASRTKGIASLKEAIKQKLNHPSDVHFKIDYPAPIEKAATKIEQTLNADSLEQSVNSRWLAMRLLEEDSLAMQLTPKTTLDSLPEIQDTLKNILTEDIDIVIADTRYTWLHTLCQQVVKRHNLLGKTLSDKIDTFVLHPVFGLPLFLLMMYLLFFVTVSLGSAMIDFFDILAGTFFIDGMSALMNSLGIHSLLTFMVAEGLGGGIQVIATFIPIIATLFLGLSILESTGYMARGAFVLDRLMRFIGLPGKSFVPLLIGFGCSVPSVMATRTLKHPRDRLLTVLLAPFMSCGAKLPVYALFASVFFADNSAMIVFGLYLIGMLIAIFTGLIIKNTLLPGETSPFFMELPTYHLPVFRNIVILTWHRLKDFIWGAGKIIVPMVLVLNLLNAVDTHGNLDPEGSQDSLLSIAGKTITPLFSGLGISEENWPASVGIFTGILAKEAVVGTLDALYSRMEETDSPSNSESDEEEEETFSLTQGISEAFSSLTQNFSELFGALLDPLGIGGSLEEAQESQSSTKTAMQNSFDSTSGAFAYLLFILLYMPCAAAMGAVYRETGGRWALFVATWSTGLAYSVSTLFYQISRFTVHPLSSSIWIVSIVCIATTVILLLKKKGDEQNTLSE